VLGQTNRQGKNPADLAEQWRKSCGGETGKSMKAVELAVCGEVCWRKIPITLKPINECYGLPRKEP
jgi:hypothetical protein